MGTALGLGLAAASGTPLPPVAALSVTVTNGPATAAVTWTGPAAFVGSDPWGNIAEASHGGTTNHALGEVYAGGGTDTWLVYYGGGQITGGNACTCTIDAGSAQGETGPPNGTQSPAVTNNA